MERVEVRNVGFRDEAHNIYVGPVHPAVLQRMRLWGGRWLVQTLRDKFDMSLEDWVRQHQSEVLQLSMTDAARVMQSVLGKTALPIVTDELVLPPGRERVWINVNNVAVCVVRTDEGVVVDLWPLKHDDPAEGSLASCWISFAEAAPDDSDAA